MDCLGSCLTNKYAEGLPGKRYYGGNEIIDQIENLCKSRALEAQDYPRTVGASTCSPYSGSPANFAMYTGLLSPHARIMGLDLPSGGHLTHGFYTLDKKTMSRKPVSATSVYFESLPYRVHPETGLIDFDELAKTAGVFKPALIVCGGLPTRRDWDYAKFREIADANGSLLMMDMAHISGLVAAQEAADPFKYCDIVTTTTHKSLRGPRVASSSSARTPGASRTRSTTPCSPRSKVGPRAPDCWGCGPTPEKPQNLNSRATSSRSRPILKL